MRKQNVVNITLSKKIKKMIQTMLLQQMEMKRVLMLTKAVGVENVLKDVNNEEPSTKPFDVNSVTIEDRNHQKAHKK